MNRKPLIELQFSRPNKILTIKILSLDSTELAVYFQVELVHNKDAQEVSARMSEKVQIALAWPDNKQGRVIVKSRPYFVA